MDILYLLELKIHYIPRELPKSHKSLKATSCRTL